MKINKNINFISLFAGIFMILVSFVNYLMNEDYASLGIFAFLGIGFILLSIKSMNKDAKSKRIQKYAMTFFFMAFVIFLYWIAEAKLHLF